MKDVEQAQLMFNKAVKAHEDAVAVAQRLAGDRALAREKLLEAKRVAAAEIPVDRNARMLSGDKQVDGDHREIDPSTGQQKGYVVLTPEERAKGFVRPVRDAYRHLKCGKITMMGRDIAETYARDPGFYSGTFCTTCREHFPVGENGEFTWYEMDGTEGQKVGT